MAGSVFDSALYAQLFPTGEAGRLFTDSAQVRAMLLVEGALAKVQGALGTIPEVSAQFIARAAMEVQIDPAGLADETGRNGVSVPALVAAFRTAMDAPDHAQYVHWGATSQDIIDTALMLRLRQALALIEADMRVLLGQLAALAETHATLPMAARTYGQHATPTSFGAVVAAWGAPLLDLLGELEGLRAQALLVSLSGAAGTAGALGPDAPRMRAELAAALGLSDPGRSWHTDRAPVLRIADWMQRVCLTLGKMGEDITALTQTDTGEVLLGGAGASSTMPQKQNPVASSVLAAIARQNTGLIATLQGAAMPLHQREGAAWFTEWMCLPQIVLGTASALGTAVALTKDLAPRSDRMVAALEDGLGMIHAEALSFALAQSMPRPEAQAETKALCKAAMESQTPLRNLARQKWPDLDVDAIFDPAQQLGTAPAEARRFAQAVRDLPRSDD